MKACEYPPCPEPAFRQRAVVVEPEPIWIELCIHHDATLERSRLGDEPDFWRWALAMMGAHGAG